MTNLAEENKALGLRINSEIWNKQRFELIPECFAEDFIADYSPRVVRTGRDQIEQMVKAAHSTFSGFTETVHAVVADDERIVLHFTISGVQVGDWGSVPATNKPVKYDEIVIMKVKDGKVVHQVGVTDSLLALQQMGRIPDPAGYVEKSLS
ncbi:MAG: ester cyclase [Pseudomonadota bacterium]